MNKSDSERVAAMIEDMGYHRTEKEEDANLLGVLACSVRQKPIDKAYSKIHKWNQWKNHHNLITFISGCILPQDREKFLTLFDIIFQISELQEFPDMLKQYGVTSPLSLNHPHENIDTGRNKKDGHAILYSTNGHLAITGNPLVMKKPEVKIQGFWNVVPHYHSDFEAFIPIQNGCDKFCTFCAVPYTRGREISRSSKEILREIRHLVEKDYKSITLLGQNVNSYGRDKKGKELSFPELLKKIGEYGDTSEKDFWIYFTSPHPRDMTPEVLEVISQYACLANQIHLPVQSGDDKVLIRMNRNHSVSDYRKIMNDIHRLLPEATVFTDIIVGFTGETNEQFENTRKIMEEFKYNMAYIAKYSPRPGAASSRWKDDIPHKIKTERLHILTEELKKHSFSYNKKLIGKTVKVLVTGKDRKEGFLSALTEGKIIVRFVSPDDNLIGRFAYVKITSVTEFATEGDLVTEKAPELIHT